MHVSRSFALLLLASVAATVDAHAAPAPVANGIIVHEANTLTRDQFAALPDNAVVNTRGGRTTAGALRAKQKANALALQGRVASAKKAAVLQVEAAVLKVQADEKARLDTSNARLRIQASKLVVQPAGTPSYNGPPEIQSAPATIEPGSFVALDGRGFGSQPGVVVMKGLPTGDRALTIESWKSTALALTLPSDIAGVQDQSVRLQVVRKDGKPSAEYSVAFKATREAKHLLPASLVKCSDNATDNNCDASSGFFAVHTEDTFWETDAAGCDEWKIPTLKNGWTVQDFTVTEMSNGGGSVGGMQRPSPLPGATSGSWKACWSVPGTGGYSGNGAGYMGFYVIAGPKGVPYK